MQQTIDIKSLPVVGDRECHVERPARQVDPDVAGVAVLDGVHQRLLRDSEYAQRDVLIDLRRYVAMGEGNRQVRR